MRTNIRDPLVGRLLGPGKAFDVVDVEVQGVTQQVFKGAPRTLSDFYKRAMAFGDRTLVVHDDVRLTFAETFGRAAALARALRERFGVTPGAKVAVVMANRVEWLIAVIAVTAAGGVAVLVNSRGVAEEMLRAMTTHRLFAGDSGCGARQRHRRRRS